MIIKDTMQLDASGLTITRDGYLTGDAKVSRAGNVQSYYGYEIGLSGEDAGKVYGVYRDPDTVFDKDSMLSLAGRPVTRGHPPVGVTADNWKKLTVGQIGGTIRRDGEHVVAPMAIMDASAVQEVQAGARSLSAGYTCEIVADSGVSPGGDEYQYRQSGPLRFNHVAYLPDNNPRAGNTRIGDSWGVAPINDNAKQGITPKTTKEGLMTTKTVVLGDKAVQVLAEDAAEVERFKDAAAKSLADTESKHAQTLAAKDAELEKLQAQLDDAKSKILSDADIDAKAAARAELIATAKKIAPTAELAGLSDSAIRKTVVATRLGDAAIADKSDAYIDARFDILAEDTAPTDPVKDALLKTTNDSADDGHSAYVARLTRNKEA